MCQTHLWVAKGRRIWWVGRFVLRCHLLWGWGTGDSRYLRFPLVLYEEKSDLQLPDWKPCRQTQELRCTGSQKAHSSFSKWTLFMCLSPSFLENAFRDTGPQDPSVCICVLCHLPLTALAFYFPIHNESSVNRGWKDKWDRKTKQNCCLPSAF